MPNRSITKAMLKDVSQSGGRDIKLQYNIFTNIMTRMISHVKKYIAYKKITLPPLYVFILCLGGEIRFSSCVIQTERWLKTFV